MRVLICSVLQACLYRKFDAPQRASMLAQLVKQLDVLEGVCVGPYIAGQQLTGGDSALMPTFVFLTFILPRYFGWDDVFAGRPKLAAWWARMQQDPVAKRVSGLGTCPGWWGRVAGT
jgi:glutathione S-transferase